MSDNTELPPEVEQIRLGNSAKRKARAKPTDPLPADKETVQRFLHIISTQAARACSNLASPGYLQISKVHPDDDRLSVSGRFSLADVDGMTAAAVADAESGHNSYIEARTVQATAPGRGKISHTVGVFALVIDSDADTGKAHESTSKTLKPSMTVETSVGNCHDWYFLTRAISAKEAAEIGEAIRRCTGTDHDTGVPTQPYRIAGTPNYPNKSKLSRGRFEVHQTRFIECPGQTYSADELRAAFPKPQTSEKTYEKSDDNIDWRIAEEALPEDLKYLIQHGAEEGTRSEQFHHTVGWLKRLGWSAANIVLLLANDPNGIANKFRDRLEREVARSFEKCEGPPRTDHDGDDDEKDLTEMNAKYAVVKVGGKTRVVEFEESPTYPGCKVPVFSTIADFCAFHAKRKKRIPAFKGSKEVGIGKWWIDHPKRQQFEGVAYLPGSDNSHVLNLWRGFAVEPKEGNCDLYLTHLRENICRNNQEHFEYLLNWMAHAVQYPGRRCEVAIVMRGREGTGKGIAAGYFGGLFGAHCRHISQPKHLTGHFNSHLLHCSVLHADEAFFAGDRSHEGVLKALITEPTILIEPKGIDPFAIPNCLHIIMSSNADWVIPASAEARRYAVFDVDPAHLQDRAYFAAIVEEMEKKGGREALLYLLQHLDLSGFDVRAIPQTQALADQKAHSRRGVDRLIEIIAHDGILPSPHRRYSDVTLTTGGENGEGFYDAARSLVPDLKYDSPIVIHKKLTEDWGCAAWKSGYQRGLKFPPLKELRDRFDKKHGPQKWPVVEGERVEWGDVELDEPSF